MGRSHGGAGQVQVTPVVARGTDRGPRGNQFGFNQKGGVRTGTNRRTSAGRWCYAKTSIGADAYVAGAKNIDFVDADIFG